MSYLAVFVGGGIGSVLRFALARWAIASGRELLWGTLAANVLACLLLGYLASGLADARLTPTTRLLLATGLCGGFSTFSTFSLEALTLAQNGRVAHAALYVALSFLLGIAAIALWGLRPS